MLGLRILHTTHPPRTVPCIGNEITMGRLPSNVVVLDAPEVADVHGSLRDQGKRGCLFLPVARRARSQIDGQLVRMPMPFDEGSRLELGPFVIERCRVPALPEYLPGSCGTEAALSGSRQDMARLAALAPSDARARASLYIEARRRHDLDACVQAIAQSEATSLGWRTACHILEMQDPSAAQCQALREAFDGWPSRALSAPALWIRRMLSGAHEPRLTMVRRLSLDVNARIPSQGLAHLAACSELAFLDILELGNLHVADRGMKTLSSSEHLSGVRHLELSSNSLTVAGLRMLLSSPLFEGLESLDLSNNYLGDDGAIVLADAPQARCLKTLRLYRNAIGPEGIAALKSSEFMDGDALESY